MLTIRRYTPADHETVMQLHILPMLETGAYLGRGPWDADLDAIEEIYFNNHGEFLVGECEGQLVAMGALRRTSSTRAEIKRMRVASAYQGRGFGTLILNELEARARALGYTTLHLDTGTVQVAAQKMYEKHGFRKVGTMYIKHVECILYEKEL